MVFPKTISAVLLLLWIAVFLSDSAENIPTKNWAVIGEEPQTRVQEDKGPPGQPQGQTRKQVSVSASTCPVLKKASCDPKNKGTECVCPGLANTNTTKTKFRGGTYSCQNSICAYCVKPEKACRPDNIEFPCCTTSNQGCYQAIPGSLNSKYYCLGSCSQNRQYLKCKDPVTGEVVPGDYTSCNGSVPNTFTICTDHYDFSKPEECATPGGGKCNFFTDRYETCCSLSQICGVNGTCVGFCAASKNSTCTKRSDVNRCMNNSQKFVNCTGISYRGRFLACRGADIKSKNTLFECAGKSQIDRPRECGTTGAKCQIDLTVDAFDTCCTGFSCVKGQCEEECKGGAAGCKINTVKRACADADSVKNSFISCPLNGVTYSARYLSCNGSDPNTFIECSKKTRPITCGVTGFGCNPARSKCCAKFKCSNSTMKCEPGM